MTAAPSTLSAAFEAAARAAPDSLLAILDTGERVSLGSFYFTVQAFAEEAAALEIRPGTRVINAVRDSIAGTALTLALLRLGAVILPDLDEVVEADLRLCLPGQKRELMPEAEVTQAWVRSPRRLTPVSGDGLLVKASSGTTGLPKLRVMTETTLLARIRNGLDRRDGPMGLTLNGYAPLSSPGFQHFLRAVLDGRPQVFQQATPGATLAMVRREAVAEMRLPPRTFAELLTAATPGPFALKRIMVGGGAISPDLALAGEATFGCPIFTTYGTNETGSIAHHRYALGDPPGLVGTPYPGVAIRLAKDDGLPDAEGEVLIRVKPDLRPLSWPTREALSPDGWISTGDIGRLGQDGRLVLTGRKSEFLNLGGDKYAPSRLERLIVPHEMVAELVIAAVPRPSGLDAVGIAVVPAAGFSMEAFAAHCANSLPPGATFYIQTIVALPWSAAGKADRKAVTALFSKLDAVSSASAIR